MKLRNTREVEKNGPASVAFYIRVSSDKQAKKQDGSLDTQLDLLNKFVEYKRSAGVDWVVGERYVEGEQEGRRRGRSAKDTNRPTFQKMLSAARAGLIDIIIFTKIDRISRSVVDFLLLVEDLDKYGVKVVSLHEQIDLTTPAGKFQTIIMIALAQHEREVISARVKEKVKWRAEKGLPLGRPPIGYVMKNKMFEIDEPYAAHVRALDALYLEHQSADAVFLEFRKRGYRTPSGGSYTKPMICRMLRSPIYAARLEHEGALHDAQWKPIRSWDTHQRIQGLMDRNSSRNRSDKRQPVEHVYLLQGLVRCGACGHKMSPKSGTGRSGASYPYYTCGYAEKSKGFDCRLRFVPAEALDRAILEFLRKLHLEPERLKRMAALARESRSETLGKLRADLERVRERLGNVRSKLSHLADAIADGGKAVMVTLREKLEALEGERAELEAAEARLKTELESEQVQLLAFEDQVENLAFFHTLVEKSEGKPERIKALLPRFVEYVVWHASGKGEGKLEVSLFSEPLPEALAAAFPAADQSAGPRFAHGYQMVRREGLEPTTR